MVTKPSHNMFIRVLDIPPKSELVQVVSTDNKLLAVAVCSPLAKKKCRFVYSLTLLDHDKADQVSILLEDFLQAEKCGRLETFPKANPVPRNYNCRPQAGLFKKLVVWGSIVLCSIVVNLTAIYFLRF